MSFKDFNRVRRAEAQPTMPRVVVQQNDEGPPRIPRKTRPIVLNGKVQHISDDEEEENFADVQQVQTRRNAILKRPPRRSDFSQLAMETQQYQKLISDLSVLLENSSETPEASWRARILMKSAKETDKELWGKLYDYEMTLVMKRNNWRASTEGKLRTEQSACMKLHRDFNRSHKALLVAMTLFDKKQTAEISRLGAVGWNNGGDDKEDFYDRAMREREKELLRIHESIHQVNDVYNSLATLVEGQQFQIDHISNDVEYSKGNVEAAASDFGCNFDFGDHLYSAFGIDLTNHPWSPFPVYDDSVKMAETNTSDADPGAETKKNAFKCIPNCFKIDSYLCYDSPETLTNDYILLKSDIVKAGQDILEQGSKFECIPHR